MISLFWLAVASSSFAFVGAAEAERCPPPERDEFPVLCHFLDRVQDDPLRLAHDLQAFSRDMGLLVPVVGKDLPKDATTTSTLTDTTAAAAAAATKIHRHLRIQDNKNNNTNIPVVMAHGMGDSCFNSGMISLTKYAAQLLGNGTCGTCVPTGDNQQEDAIHGHFKSMNDNVDIFATKVKADPRLSHGFYGIGLSQGNNVLRGHITKYNDPPVLRFISINGVNGGTGALPNCFPKLQLQDPAENVRSTTSGRSSICDLLEEQASKRAYSKFYQDHNFQAGYWRDPRPSEKQAYQTYSQLAQWNNEGSVINETYKANWALTDKFIWIKADRDEMVWPAEGEWFGAPDPTDPFNKDKILPTNETEWYTRDLFGLKTAEEAGKNVYESFDGDHLQFTDDMFKQWVTNYLT